MISSVFTVPGGRVCYSVFITCKGGDLSMRKRNFAKRLVGCILAGTLVLSGIPAGTFAEEDVLESMSESDLLYMEEAPGSEESFYSEESLLSDSFEDAQLLENEEDFIIDEGDVLEEELFEESALDVFDDETGSDDIVSDEPVTEEILAEEDDSADLELADSDDEETTYEESSVKADLGSDEMSSAQTLNLGSVVMKGSDRSGRCYKLVPEETAVYTISPQRNTDAYMEMELYLYDDQGKFISGAEGYDVYADYDEYHYDLKHILTEGKTYYLKAYGWTDDGTDYDYTITFSKAENKFCAQVDGPTYFKVRAGEQISLHVNAMGSNEISYSWQINGVEVCTEATYVHTVANKSQIICFVNTPDEGSSSFIFTVEVDNNFSAYAEYADGKGKKTVTKYIELGSPITLTPHVEAYDLTNVTYQWSGGISGTDASVQVTPTEYTLYKCKISDGFGNSATVKYNVYIDNGFKAYPKGADMKSDGSYPSYIDLYADSGETLTLEAVVEARDTSQISYAWYKDYNDENMIGTGSSLTITCSDDGESYCCIVRDQYGNREDVEFYIEPKLNVKGIGVLQENTRTQVSGMTDETKVFSFVPSVTSAYAIYSVEKLDNWIKLYDQNRTGSIASNYRGADGFCLQYNLVAGQTYYVKVGLEWEEDDPPRSFQIGVARVANGRIQTPGQGTEKPPVHTHAFGAWSQVQAPTALAEGVEKRTCACGASETRPVAKLAATMQLNVSGTLPLKTQQTCKAVRVSNLAEGDYVLSVTSSNTKSVKVSFSGLAITLKGQKKTGTAAIKVLLASGLEKSFNVKVGKAEVKTKKITVASKKVTIQKGKTFNLNAAITPISSKEKITFSTSDKKVARVSGRGVIKASGKGKATITVKSGNKTVKVKVIVK